MSDTNEQNGFSEDQKNAIENAIKGIDVDQISKDEVFLDFIGRLKRFNFECSVALHLLEKKTIAEMVQGTQSETQVENEK